jgi:hypothetical protein
MPLLLRLLLRPRDLRLVPAPGSAPGSGLSLPLLLLLPVFSTRPLPALLPLPSRLLFSLSLPACLPSLSLLWDDAFFSCLLERELDALFEGFAVAIASTVIDGAAATAPARVRRRKGR